MPLPRPTWRYEDRITNVPDGFCLICGHGVAHGEEARALIGTRTPATRPVVVCAPCAIEMGVAIEAHPAGARWLARARAWWADFRLKQHRATQVRSVPASVQRTAP